MILYTANYTQNANNVYYPNQQEIHNLDQLKAAVKKDHIAANMWKAHRANEDFKNSNCVMLDLDNTHSNDPADWKDIDDIIEVFEGVAFYYIQSKNHLKQKKKVKKDGTVIYYEPRPKYHIYFPLQKKYDVRAEYELLMLKTAGLFPYFDLGAAKPAQYFDGVYEPAGGYEAGERCLDPFVNEQPAGKIAAAVKDFENKINDGTYKLDEAQEKGARKAISRLYSELGIPQSNEPATAGAVDQAPQADAEYSELGQFIAEAEQRRSLEWLKSWAQKYGVELGKAYRIKSREHPGAICICVICPWEDNHTMDGAETESVIIIELGGKIGYLCRHNHCFGRGWKDYRNYYEARAAQNAETGAEDRNTGEGNETPTDGAQAPTLPGLLTYDAAVNIFETADDRQLTLKSFPTFSKTAKIKIHDSIVIAADTGAGKSSLALNFLNNLNEEYPVLYINLEMDKIDVLRRLAAIESGIILDKIEGYQQDEKTAAAVNVALKTITGRKPLQIIQGAYYLQEIETIIKQSTAGREEPTIVFIDHSLLVDTQKSTGSRYDRFTQVSEGLRKIALANNVVLFVLLQQNRTGKANDEARPQNSSLKESGSWENDATQIMFLWYDPTDRKKKILLTKNRHGSGGEFTLSYWKQTQTYTEAPQDTQNTQPAWNVKPAKPTKREIQKRKLEQAYRDAYITTFGKVTIRAMAEAADVTTGTIKRWIKEYGGCTIDGRQVDPAGADQIIEYHGFVKLTPADDVPEEFAKVKTTDSGMMKVDY